MVDATDLKSEIVLGEPTAVTGTLPVKARFSALNRPLRALRLDGLSSVCVCSAIPVTVRNFFEFFCLQRATAAL